MIQPRSFYLCASQLVALPLALIAFEAGSVSSQDPFGSDPLGGNPMSSDPFGSLPTTNADASTAAPLVVDSTANAIVEDELDPLVRLLRVSPPRTPAEVAQAIDWMTKIGRWDEVGRLLDTVQKLAWSRDQLSEFSSSGGASLWFRLRDAGKELTDQQHKFVREVSALPSQLAREPAWIDSWIDRLNSKTAGERREAQLRLQRAHRAGVERLCQRLLTGDPRIGGVLMVEALLEFNADGVEALRAACMSNDLPARSRVLLSLAQSSSNDFGVELSSALYSSVLSPAAKQTLSDALAKKYRELPDAVKVHDFLVARFKKQLDDYQLSRAHPAHVPVTAWRIAADGLAVKAVEISTADRSLESLAQLATHRVAFGSRTHGDLVDSATVLLQHAYQAGPEVELIDPANGFEGWLPESASGTDFWKQVFDRSEDWQMHGAAIRSAQAIGRDLAGSPSGSAIFNFVAGFLRDSRPVVRYLAVESIVRADSQSDYNGSAAALEVAIEMSRLKPGPLVLVVGLTGDLRIAANQQLAAIGAHTIDVNSTQAALQVLDEPYPVEMIMVVDRVPNNSVRSLVERLRHSKRGRLLPVAVMTDQLPAHELNDLSRLPGVVLSVLSENKQHMPRIIQSLEARLDVRPLASIERSIYAEMATMFLIKIASNRELYGFYPLVRWEKDLQATVDSMPVAAWLTILGGLGTSASQEQLAAVVGNPSATAENRQRAADEFARSVERFGLLVAPKTQLKAYEIYNSLGPRDPVTVSVVGQMLDTIETKTGKGETALAP